MKRNQRILAFAAAVSITAAASGQTTNTLIESWENTTDGWTVLQSPFDSLGFSTTTGVTDGSYSWIVGPSATNTGQGPDYSAMLASPSTMAITSELGAATSLSIDVYTPPGSFGYYLQWDLALNNTDIGGYTSVDGYNYQSLSLGNERTLTWNLPSSITSVLATSTNPTSITFQMGGGYSAGNETMYLDNIVASNSPPPVTFISDTANWVTNGSSIWENASNWSDNPNIPGADGSILTFDNNGGSITANPVITLSQNAAATLIAFGNTNGGPTPNYTINSGAPGTTISVSSEIDSFSGSHAINVPVATASGNFYFDVLSGASLSIPNFSDTSYSNITKLDTGTLTLGASLHCNIFVDGTMTFNDGTSGGWFYGINVYGDGIVNLGSNNIWTNNTLADADSSGNGLITIGSGGILYTALFSDDPYSAKFGGAGSIVIGGDVNGAGSDTSTHTASFYGDNTGFSGTMTVSTNNAGAFTLQVVTASALGDGSSANKLILDGGIFQALGSFTGTQGVMVTANNGTIDTNNFGVGLGAVSSTASATLTKINSGELSVPKITGVSLAINGGTVQLTPNGTAAGASSFNALTLAVDGNNVPQGSLDITNNEIIIVALSSNDPISTIKGYLLTGYDAGRWDGAGIQSSSVLTQPGTSIGYADGNTDTGTAAAVGTIVVMDTWLGDLNLDGGVTGSDLNTLMANIGDSGAGVDWAHGDLNYDGTVNNDDVSLFMLGAAEYKAGGSLPVPEPASLGLLVMGAGILGRRRRR